ncbi:MAG: hypothetical protein HYY35_04760 [Deltaproteobacteria bacterium]|nr:hypothetical protein [Deltaproteobacteria bacterium]
MLRWFLLLAAIGCAYWIYQRSDLRRAAAPTAEREAAAPAATLAPGGRLGGGLNPFVTDTDVDAPPQRPPAP